MANKPKIGLDYFPFEVDFFSDIKVRKLIRYQSGKALSVYTHLLCNIYKNGYYMLWDDELPFVISESLPGYEEGYISEVIKCCLTIGLFSEKMFKEKKILTSKGIQERYGIICKLLKRVAIVSEEFRISSEEINIASEEIQKPPEEFPQRKGKKRKEKERKEIPPPAEDEILNFCKSQLTEEEYKSLEFSIKTKFRAWKENEWHDGNGKKIINWKSKILNTIPYLEKSSGKKENVLTKKQTRDAAESNTINQLSQFNIDYNNL